jgi:hypothetical protein
VLVVFFNLVPARMESRERRKWGKENDRRKRRGVVRV